MNNSMPPIAWTDLITLERLVFWTGFLHLCQLPAMLFAPRMLDWKRELGSLRPINRRIVQVIGGGIMLVVQGMGVVVMAAPGEIASGERLGNALACFLAVFWAYRAVVQIALYSNIWPANRIGRLSHWGLTALFTFQTGAYALVFVIGTWR